MTDMYIDKKIKTKPNNDVNSPIVGEHVNNIKLTDDEQILKDGVNKFLNSNEGQNDLQERLIKHIAKAENKNYNANQLVTLFNELTGKKIGGFSEGEAKILIDTHGENGKISREQLIEVVEKGILSMKPDSSGNGYVVDYFFSNAKKHLIGKILEDNLDSFTADDLVSLINNFTNKVNDGFDKGKAQLLIDAYGENGKISRENLIRAVNDQTLFVEFGPSGNGFVVDYLFLKLDQKNVNALEFEDDQKFSDHLAEQVPPIFCDATVLALYRNSKDSTQGKMHSINDLNQAIEDGIFEKESVENGGTRVTLKDGNITLRKAIENAPDDTYDAARLASFLNALTGTQTDSINATQTSEMINFYTENGVISRENLLSAVDQKFLSTEVNSVDNSIKINFLFAAPTGNENALGSWALNGYATVIQTPNSHGDPDTNNVFQELGSRPRPLSEFEVNHNSKDNAMRVGLTYFYAVKEGDDYKLFMSCNGKKTWRNVFNGKGDCTVITRRTYEWDVGTTGLVSGSESDNFNAAGGMYTRVKPFETLWVFEKPRDTDADNDRNRREYKSFRARTYAPVETLTALGTDDGTYSGATNSQIWMDFRWGTMNGVPKPNNSAKLTERGFIFNVGMAAEPGVHDIITSAFSNDWETVADIVTDNLNTGVSLANWQFGLFAAKEKSDDFVAALRNRPGNNQLITNILAPVVNFIGNSFQHLGLVLTAGAALNPFNTNDELQLSSEEDTQELAVNPIELDDLSSVVEGNDPISNVFNILGSEEFIGKLLELSSTASQAITYALTTKKIIQALKGKGISIDKLDKDQEAKLIDLVMQEAAQLLVAKAGPTNGPQNLADQYTLLMQPDENQAEYMERFIANLTDTIPDAVQKVLMDESFTSVLLEVFNLTVGGALGTGGKATAAAAAAAALTVKEIQKRIIDMRNEEEEIRNNLKERNEKDRLESDPNNTADPSANNTADPSANNTADPSANNTESNDAGLSDIPIIYKRETLVDQLSIMGYTLEEISSAESIDDLRLILGVSSTPTGGPKFYELIKNLLEQDIGLTLSAIAKVILHFYPDALENPPDSDPKAELDYGFYALSTLPDGWLNLETTLLDALLNLESNVPNG